MRFGSVLVERFGGAFCADGDCVVSVKIYACGAWSTDSAHFKLSASSLVVRHHGYSLYLLMRMVVR